MLLKLIKSIHVQPTRALLFIYGIVARTQLLLQLVSMAMH